MDQRLSDHLHPNRLQQMVQTQYSKFMKRHANRNNRRLHFLGWFLAFLITIQAIFTWELGNILYTIPIIVIFAFCGHYFCEGDYMSCQDPMGSCRGHIQMIKQIVTRKMQF